MKKILILLTIWMAAISCASLPGFNTPKNMEEPKTDEQLRAEYHLMRNNLNLAIRENEVVKGENRICKAEIRQLKNEVKGLKADLVTLNRNYEQDMSRMYEQYGALEIQYKMLEEQSNAKIQELTDLNTATLSRLAQETVQFNQALNKQKSEFRAERDGLKAEMVRQTNDYESNLNAMTKTMAEKNTEIDFLNSALIQAAAEIEKLKNAVAESQVRTGNMQKTIDEFKAASDKSLNDAQPAPETVEQAPKQISTPE